MAQRKRATKAETARLKVQATPVEPPEPTYRTRILPPYSERDRFGARGIHSEAWLNEIGPGLISALSWGYEVEDAITRSACCVLLNDVLELNAAALAARQSAQAVRVEVRYPIGSALELDYADALRDLTHAVRLQAGRPGYGGPSEDGFEFLSDLLVEHMNALADGSSDRVAKVA